MQTYLSSFILSNADQHNEVQPKLVRIVKVPEYFAEYREKGDGLAAFLGSSIVAKARLFQFALIVRLERVSVGNLPRRQKFHLKSGLRGERSQSGA